MLMFGLAMRARGEPLPHQGELVVGKGAVEDLHIKMQDYVSRGLISNISFGIWQHGTLLNEGNYGPISDTNKASVSDTTIYRIRSMTTPITAIGLMILMERGHFKLSDPMTKFLPEFDATETLADYDPDGSLYTYLALYPPTMGQLLSHTAGLAYWHPKGGIIDRKLYATDVAVAPDTDTLVDVTSQLPYVSMPGAEWNYSIASDLQGAIIERITGETLDTFLDRELFQPLGMDDTSFYVAKDHQTRLSGVTRLEEDQAVAVALEPSDPDSQSKVYAEGGHGLYSTRKDYFKFLDLLRRDGRVGGQQILTPNTLTQFRSNAITYRGQPGRQQSHGKWAGLGFGLGIGTLEDPVIANMSAPKGTNYWYGALGTWFWIDPVNDIVFIGMIQSETQIEPDMMRTAMTAIYGNPSPEGGLNASSANAVGQASEGSG